MITLYRAFSSLEFKKETVNICQMENHKSGINIGCVSLPDINH